MIGFHRMRRFPLVHTGLTALIDNPAGIANNHIFRRHAHRLDQLHAGNRGRTGAVHHHPRFGNLSARDVQSIDQAGSSNNRRTMLIVVENRDIQQFF